MDTQHEEMMEPTGNPERDMDEGRHEPEDGALVKLLALEKLFELAQEKELLVDELNSGHLTRKDGKYVELWDEINDIVKLITDIKNDYGFN